MLPVRHAGQLVLQDGYALCIDDIEALQRSDQQPMLPTASLGPDTGNTETGRGEHCGAAHQADIFVGQHQHQQNRGDARRDARLDQLPFSALLLPRPRCRCAFTHLQQCHSRLPAAESAHWSRCRCRGQRHSDRCRGSWSSLSPTGASWPQLVSAS